MFACLYDDKLVHLSLPYLRRIFLDREMHAVWTSFTVMYFAAAHSRAVNLHDVFFSKEENMKQNGDVEESQFHKSSAKIKKKYTS